MDPAFGTSPRGEEPKGPIKNSKQDLEKGSVYHFSKSSFTMWSSITDGLIHTDE